MNEYFNAENIKGVYQQAMAYDVGEALLQSGAGIQAGC